VARRLLEAGLAYESFSSPDEVEDRRRAAGQDPKLGYDNADWDTTEEQKAAFRAEGRLPTTEALVLAIRDRLRPHLPLVGLRLYEQPSLWVDVLASPSTDPMEAFLSIRTHFAAAHRLARPELSQSENEAIYGKCARPHGHGHNYLLDVTVRGPIDARTGMVCDLAELQRLVADLVVEPFDHTFLNKDVEHFAGCVPTAENIALHIADLLSTPIAATGARLHKVRLQESPNNAAEVFAETPQLEMLPAALEALAAV
jgi:6-pyruvoyltetrahydropterin/6-carboxytetrahydropterin synthase